MIVQIDWLGHLDARLPWSPNPASPEELKLPQAEYVHKSFDIHRLAHIAIANGYEAQRAPEGDESELGK